MSFYDEVINVINVFQNKLLAITSGNFWKQNYFKDISTDNNIEFTFSIINLFFVLNSYKSIKNYFRIGNNTFEHANYFRIGCTSEGFLRI